MASRRRWSASSTAASASFPRLVDVLFDIDGTLVRSYPHEDELYDRALQSVGLALPTTDYHALGASTDVSILRVLAQRAWKRDPTDAEIEQVRSVHTRGWESRLERSGIEVMPGARDVLSELRARGARFAAATGGFRVTATTKLAAAALSIEVVAAAEDGLDRPELLARAAGDARPVYVGDGLWDAAAAASNGLDFIGVAESEERARAFRERGCRVVSALAGVLDLLE